MNVFLENDYKSLIREQVKNTPRLTLRKVAQNVGVQYTYLSRSLNDEKTHLSEDNLFAICKILKLFPEEVDYVLLLRSFATAVNEDRKKHLQDRLNRIRRAQRTSATFQESESRQLNREMEYLFDPNSLIVVISLTVQEYFENPFRLCVPLGITAARLQQILRNLSDLGFVELNPDGRTVKKLLRAHFHYGTDHPLMRVHQALLRNLCGTQLSRVPEDEKHCLMVTFSANEDAFEDIKSRFHAFVSEVERQVKSTQQKKTYQMNFELFNWL